MFSDPDASPEDLGRTFLGILIPLVSLEFAMYSDPDESAEGRTFLGIPSTINIVRIRNVGRPRGKHRGPRAHFLVHRKYSKHR